MFLRKKEKIFCISFQRTGTTSVGQFFKYFNYKVANYQVNVKNDWTKSWFDGDYERIFNSKDFKDSNVFEDNPWWCLDFYKVLFYRFPNAKFVLITRNADKWFDSMVSHSNGKTLGNTYRHCRLYRRETEYYKKFGSKVDGIDTTDNLLDLDESYRKHYTEIYNIRNQDVIEFFRQKNASRLILLELEDNEKWKKLGIYFKINIPKNFEIHANASAKK